MVTCFQQVIKFLICDFTSFALQAHYLTTGCQTTFCFATWTIPFGVAIPVLRTTALISPHNTIFKGFLMKKNHKHLPSQTENTFSTLKYFLSHQAHCVCQAHCRWASCLQKVLMTTINVQYVCIRNHPQFSFL